MKSPIKQLAMLGALLLLPAVSPTVFGQVTMTDIGATDPTPGPNDLSQFSITGDVKFPDNLNYYTDNGANNGFYAGQTFTTGNNPGGYQLTSVYIKMGGLDNGGGYDGSQMFHLYIYSISGGKSTVIKSYTATSSFTDGDWLLWTNLAVEVTPNTTYAYGFGRDASGSGWAGVGNNPSDPYTGGELAMLRGPGVDGFPISFGSIHSYDGAFVIGLTPSTADSPPQISTQPSSATAYTNAPITFNVGLDLNAAAPSYQWWKGTSPINGETNASLTIPNAQMTDAADYTVVITNIFGAITSSVASLTVAEGEPNVVSVQLLPGAPWNTPNTALAAGDTAGAFPTVNWNSGTVLLPAYGNNTTNTFIGLKDGSGNASSVQLTVMGVSDAWRYNDPPPDSAPITKLLNTFVKTTNPGGGNTLGNGLMQFVYSNLDDSKTYDIYVYVGGGSDVHPYVDAGNGTTVYSGPEFGSVNQNSSFVGCYNTDPNGTRNQANFVQLKDVIPTAGAITVSVQYDPALDTSAGGDLGVSGLQIVESSLDAVAPTIQKQPASATVYTNVPTTFTVSALGVPTPNLQWYEVVGGVTNLISGATGSSYTVVPDASMNGNQYFAQASNPSGVTNSAAATLNLVAGTPTGVWSVKTDSGRGGYTPLAPTNSTGAFAATNWVTATVVVGGGDQTFDLNDSAGVGTPVKLITLGISDGWRIASPPPDTQPITKLLNTFVKSGTPANNGDPVGLGTGLMQFVLTNLDNAGTYSVYVYLLNNSGGNLPDVDAGTGITNYAGTEFTAVNQSSNLVVSANQDPAGPRDRGNYVHLAGVTPTDGAITVSVAWDSASTGDGIGVCGLQLVKSSLDLVPIVIQRQPASQWVLTNTPAKFSVAATGYPLNPQWYEVSGGVTNLIAGATNASYITSPVQDSDTGTGYFVVLSNSISGVVTSRMAILTAGHMFGPVAGFLENDEYFGLSDGTTALTTQLYPNSSWLDSHAANMVEYLPSFNDNADLPNNAGERIYGWFTPPVSGDYVFFMAGDDQSTLWLGTDDTTANMYQIAQNQDWMIVGNNGPTDWTLTDTGSGEYSYYSYGEWRSDQFELNGGPNAFDNYLYGWAPYPGLNTSNGGIPLVAGTKYYIELDHFQGGGGQGAAVTYKLAGNADPAVGAASLLTGPAISTMSALDGSMVDITNQPANMTVQTGNTSAFSVGVKAYVAGAPTAPAPPVLYQWYLVSGGTTNAIAGATGSSYTTVPVTSADNGKQFYCTVKTIGFQTNSVLATLTIGAPQPYIANITLSGGNLVISGSNGSANGTYYVLTSTNVAQPLNQWTPISTNTFDSSGNFNVTNNVTTGSPQQFYMLKVAP